MDIAYFPEGYMADEWLAVSPDGALVAASSIARPGATGNSGRMEWSADGLRRFDLP